MGSTTSLLHNYLVTAARGLLRNRVDSFVKIGGLAIGLAAAVIIALFVRDELGFDSHWQDAERLYRLNTTWIFPGRKPVQSAISSGPAANALANYFPNEIESSARVNNKEPTLTVGDQVHIDPVSWVDPQILDIFSFETIAGDTRASLAEPNGMIVTESMAAKYFGSENPLGQSLTVSLYGVTRNYRVGAIIRDLPANTHLDVNAMVSIVEQDFKEPAWWMFSNWKAINNHTYFKLGPGVGIEQVRERLSSFAQDVIPANADVETKLDVVAVRDIHLHPSERSEMKRSGDYQLVCALAIIAVLLVVIGAINFINLSTAQAGRRAREVALRMTLGASKSQVFAQHLGESLMVTAIAVALAAVLVESCLPFINGALDRNLLLELSRPDVLAAIFCTTMVIGVAAGTYPAVVISSFRPARNLHTKGAAEVAGSVTVRSLLVLFQTAVTVSLLIATLVVFAQLAFMKSVDRGFDPRQLVVINGISKDGAYQNRAALKDEILKLAQVEQAGFTSDPPSRPNGNNTQVRISGSNSTEFLSVGVQDVDADLLPTYRMKLLAGRNFSADRAADRIPSTRNALDGSTLNGNIVINAAAVDLFGFGTPGQALGQTLRLDPSMQRNPKVNLDLTVIGVVADTNLHSAKAGPRPEIFQVTPNNLHLVVRYTGQEKPLLEALESTWRELAPTVPFQYFLVEQALAADLRNERSQLGLFTAFTVLAVLIGGVGMYALAALIVRQRIREIALRKVLGANVRQVVNLLLVQFSRPVLVSNLIAWPVSFYLMQNWLNRFPERIDTAWLIGICLASGIGAVLIAWASVFSHAVGAAVTSPVHALKCE